MKDFINAEEFGLELYIAGKQRAKAYDQPEETNPEYGGTVAAPSHDEE